VLPSSVMPDPSVIRLKDLGADALFERLAPLGGDLRLARRLQSLAIKKGAIELPVEMPQVAKRVWEPVRAALSLPHLQRVERTVSPVDGFAKYLFRGDGPEVFESVRIPLLHKPDDRKYVVCVSSQVGCAMGCVFCATGRLGFKRNLETWEIVDQVVQVQRDSEHPVRGVVFMGMGEPMLNYDRVMRAAEILREPSATAIDAKAISISTVGVVPAIRRFTAERRPFRLVVSLTSANHEQRRELVPIENTYALPELMEAVREHHRLTGTRIVLAWTMMSGVNLSTDHARQIAELTAGLPVVLDLIDVNDPTGQFRPPDRAELDRFRDDLREHAGIPVLRRYSGGQDIHGGCGMLAGVRAAGEAGH